MQDFTYHLFITVIIPSVFVKCKKTKFATKTEFKFVKHWFLFLSLEEYVAHSPDLFIFEIFFFLKSK